MKTIKQWSIPMLAAVILGVVSYLGYVNASGGPGNMSASVFSYPPGGNAIPETTTTSAALLGTPAPKSTGSMGNFNVKNTAASPVVVMFADSASTPGSSPTTVVPIWSGVVPGNSGGQNGALYGSFGERSLLFSKGLVAYCSSTAAPVYTASTSCTFWAQLDLF